MFTKILDYLSTIGVHDEDDVNHKKRIIFINQYLLLAFFIYFLNGLGDFFFGFYQEASLLLSCIFVIGFALFLNKKRYHRYSITTLYIYICLTVLYFGSPLSYQTGDYLYYFTLVLSISFVFDFEKDKRLMIALFLFTLCLILIHTYNHQPTIQESITNESI